MTAGSGGSQDAARPGYARTQAATGTRYTPGSGAVRAVAVQNRLVAAERAFATVKRIESVLSSFSPSGGEDVPKEHKAAVAAVLREGGSGADLLFIRRAEHPRDPWSGQMGLPGGRIDPGDATPFDAAVRETLEEVGLDLARDARAIGRLSEVRTHLPLGSIPHSVSPFCFAIDGNPPLRLNHEVAEALFVSLSFFDDRSNRKSMTVERNGVPLVMPCYDREGRVIWGLTLKIVDELVEVVRGAA